MDEGAANRGWERLAPEELNKLRVGAQTAGTWDLRDENEGQAGHEGEGEQAEGDGP
jgi:hypothetical protein